MALLYLDKHSLKTGIAFSLNRLSTWLPFSFALSPLCHTFGEFDCASYSGTPSHTALFLTTGYRRILGQPFSGLPDSYLAVP